MKTAKTLQQGCSQVVFLTQLNLQKATPIESSMEILKKHNQTQANTSSLNDVICI